jgi:hypothetical protein
VNATTPAGPYDVLLEWASELGNGSWTQWCEACEELRVEATWAMRDLGALGHVEMDWTANHFACPPPTAAFLHRSSGCVLVTGARPRGFLDRLYALEDELADVDFAIHDPTPQRDGPQTVLIEVELDDIDELCVAAGLEWVFDPADRITQALPLASLEALASREDWPPRDDVPRRRFDPASMTYRVDPARDGEYGLWLYDGYRRAQAWFFDAAQWWHVPTSTRRTLPIRTWRSSATGLAPGSCSSLAWRRSRRCRLGPSRSRPDASLCGLPPQFRPR